MPQPLPDHKTPCPIFGCPGSKRMDDLFCRSCWRKVPRPLQVEIWHQFQTDRGSEAHLVAIREAFRVVEGRGPAQLRLLPA